MDDQQLAVEHAEFASLGRQMAVQAASGTSTTSFAVKSVGFRETIEGFSQPQAKHSMTSACDGCPKEAASAQRGLK